MASDSDERPPGAYYANFLVVGYNAYEFVLDFGQSYDANGRESTSVRVVTAPVYAKAMLQTLQQAVARYESEHGPIPDPDAGT